MHRQALLVLVAIALVGGISIQSFSRSATPRQEKRIDAPPPVVKVSLPASWKPSGCEAVILALHDAGLKRDEAALPRLFTALAAGPAEVQLTALWSLARLGRQEALPAIRSMIADTQASDLLEAESYARVVAAQLQATQPKPAPDTAHLRQQMQALLQTVGLPAATACRTLLLDPQTADPRTLALSKWTALQLADMVLVASKRGVILPAKASPLNLSLLPAAKVKAELSAQPRRRQIRYLVRTLAEKRNLNEDTDYLVQCLANEGTPARPAILARLKAMRKESPATYTSAAPLALFHSLEGIGGTPDSAAVVGAFRDHPDPHVRAYADDSYRLLARGVRRFRTLAS
ncbi:MAG TPA: hypothetical protein VHR86_09360 [Armatimonadota bacterium]|nr:hypothetical protein [Armatimonadota bacterium]